MIAARVSLEPEFEVLGETELFEAPLNRGRNADFHAPGGRFIFTDKTVNNPARFVRIVTNVFDLIEEDAP